MVGERQERDGERRQRSPSGSSRAGATHGGRDRSWPGPGRSHSAPARSVAAQNLRSERAPQDGPPIPPGVDARQLAPEVRRELSTLDRATADAVARHLVAAGELLDEDPEAALGHARAARARASRIAAVREAVGIAAYCCGDWAQALSEL
ncbi:MAG: tetratricopeptide repeat protein, partial [Mycobacterium sp.]|nr:tetratricopeptide repeat protein [Mycobacterium sp.]